VRLAIISDTHFGDDDCQLVSMSAGGSPQLGPKYGEFKKVVGTGNDFLVLAGDILDFSIAPYEKSYRCAKLFFEQIKNDGLANEMVYLAGNHDADIWHIVQHERSVINRIARGEAPEPFQHSVAGIIDDRGGVPQGCKGLTLNGVTAKQGEGATKYGDMFLDSITKPATVFNFAYPNLYILTDIGTVLVTHGQYLEPYWAILKEVLAKIAYDDLKVGEDDIDVEELIELNFPFNQLACTGIGQAGILTERVIRPVELDVKENNLKRLEKYIDRLRDVIDDLTNFGWLKRLVVDHILGAAKDEIMSTVAAAQRTRYSETFPYDKNVRKRFSRFYAAGLMEISSINRKPPFNSPKCNLLAPDRVIFGHTHQPIAWNDPSPPKFSPVSTGGPTSLTLHNTGGWLAEKGRFVGAEIFLYETRKGFSSVSVT
jgi:predicted phosphodiesterase